MLNVNWQAQPVLKTRIFACMLTLQSSKSRIVCLLIFKVKRDSQGDYILLTPQGVSYREVLEGLKAHLM